MPRWYLTSPEPCADFGSRCPSNSEKIFSYGLPTMLASTLSRPRWAMPMTTSSRPCLGRGRRISSSSGISDSPPSSENRRCPTNLVCRNVSNASAALSRPRMCFCSSARRASRTCCSTRSWIQRRSSGSWMCMYSTPTRRQYESRSTPSTSRSFIFCCPANPPTGNARSRSHRVRPCCSTSRSGWRRMWNSSGSVSAIRCPRTRYAWISSITRAALSIWPSEVSGTSRTQRTGSYGIRSDVKISS